MGENTLCIRCGKPRIEGKSWKEKVAGSIVYHTQTVCPDKKCQRIVETELKDKREKIMLIQNKSLQKRKAIISGHPSQSHPII